MCRSVVQISLWCFFFLNQEIAQRPLTSHMLVNEYNIEKIKYKFRIKTTKKGLQGSGNIIAFGVEGQQILPQAGAFFFKNRKLLGDDQIKFVKSLSKKHGNQQSIKKIENWKLLKSLSLSLLVNEYAIEKIKYK